MVQHRPCRYGLVCIIMATRDEIMQRFGPILIESLAIVVLDEINVIRSELGLPPRTKQQLLDQMNNHVNSLPLYDWMSEPP